MKKLLRFIGIIFLLSLLIVLIDILSMYFQNKPILSKLDNNATHIKYTGLYYNIHKCNTEDDYTLKLKWNDNFSCSISVHNSEPINGRIIELYETHLILDITSDTKIDTLKVSLNNNPTIKGSDGLYVNQDVQVIPEGKVEDNQTMIIREIKVLKENKEDLSNEIYVILDKTESCAQGLEKIYNDGKYEYFLPCFKSQNIEVNFSNGSSYSIREALSRKYITPTNVVDKGIVLVKKAITSPKGDFTIIENTNTCDNINELIYQDQDYSYYLKCQNSQYIFIKFDNGEIYSLKEALEYKYISPLLIVAKGYDLIKK